MAPTMRDLVGWTVQDTPADVVAGRRLGGLLRVVSAIATLGADATGAARVASWDLPADPEAFVDIGLVRLTGHSRLLPVLEPAGSGRVSATRTTAWLTADRSRRPAAAVPLDRLTVVGASTTSRSQTTRYPAAPWTLTLFDGSDRLELSGGWLALAWIGQLAGWPEPSPG